MTPKDITDLATNTTGVLLLAVMALWMLNAVWKERLKDSQGYAESLDSVRKQLMEVVKENTKAVQSLIDKLNK